MAVARRGGRVITVDGQPLRWWYRLSCCGSSTCSQDQAHVLISHSSREGKVISVGVWPRLGAQGVTPSLVARAVRIAISRGWKPGQGTGVIHLRDPREVDAGEGPARP